MDNWTSLKYKKKLSKTKIIEIYFKLQGTNLPRFDQINNNGTNARQPFHTVPLSRANKKASLTSPFSPKYSVRSDIIHLAVSSTLGMKGSFESIPTKAKNSYMSGE